MKVQISYSDEISKSRNEFPFPYYTQALSFCIELEFGNHKRPHRRAFESSSGNVLFARRSSWGILSTLDSKYQDFFCQKEYTNIGSFSTSKCRRFGSS